MSDPVVLSKKESLERCLQQVRKYYALETGEDFRTDYLRQDAIEMNLQRICDICIDLANMTIKRRKIGLPKDSGESFNLLHEARVIDKDLARSLRGMVGFRIILVHRYHEFNLDIMVDVIENHLGDPLRFAQIIVEDFDRDSK